MSLHNLESVFRPRSVSLIGASAKPGSVGAVVTRNLLTGFGGPVMLVNARAQSIEGHAVYPDIESLPSAPDLAVIATPPETVPALISELAKRGTRAAVVITAGFGELGDRGKALHEAMLDAAKPHLLRIVGPNCVGILAPHIRLNASFSHIGAAPGRLAFVSQSGGMITAVLDWAKPRGIGFSHVVSLGDMADIDFGDVIDYLADDEETEAILLYVEGVTHARNFLEASRRAAARKPVLAVKVGKHAESARAAASHTGALAGSDAVYEAAFRRAGILRVRRTEEMFDAVETLAATRGQTSDRLVILTNGGGPGVLATDSLLDGGGRLAALGPATIARLDTVLPKTWSRNNPVDIVGDANAKRYRKALSILLDDRETDAVLVLNCPTGIADSVESARAVVATIAAKRTQGTPKHNVFTSWLGSHSADHARKLFDAAGIATYETPDRAVRGFLHRVEFDRIHALLCVNRPPPERVSADVSAARRIIADALDTEREWLDAEAVFDLLNAYGIPMAEVRVVRDPGEAAAVAQAIGFPVALKIRSRDILHKTDVGGVALNLANADQVRNEAVTMKAKIEAAQPDARHEGFLVQKMISRPDAFELIVGASHDPTFGPVVLFGQGGIAVGAFKDTVIELAPVDRPLARAQIARTRISALLRGVRNKRPTDIDAIAETLVRVSALVTDHPYIRELDINPLLADGDGVLALDARVRVQRLGASDAKMPRPLAIPSVPPGRNQR